MRHIRLDTVDSTNSYARKLISEGKTEDFPLLVTARSQTGGRGRQGHSFYSPEGTGIYMSIAAPFETFVKCPCPTAAAAAAVFVILSGYAEDKKQLKIKWVNDIYYRGRKICGILTESVQGPDGRRYIITGIGINVSTSVFPDDIASKAGSLLCGADDGAGLTDLLPMPIAEEYLSSVSSGSLSYMDTYRANSFVLMNDRREILFTENGLSKRGTVKCIGDDASLTVITDGRETVVSSGEIDFYDNPEAT